MSLLVDKSFESPSVDVSSIDFVLGVEEGDLMNSPIERILPPHHFDVLSRSI